MHLLDSELKNKEQWEKAEISLPQFDRQAMKEETKKNPQWVHFGAGNIFRAFPAALQQKLLNEGIEKTGIIVAEGYDYEIIKKAYRPQDDLSLLVTLKANGTIEKTVIGSLAESLTVDRHDAADWNRLKEIFASNTLQMVSFTITEKGYSITSPDGAFRADVKADFEAGPENADSYIGKLAALCYWRYTQGAAPLALVSMDNCSHNGDKLFAAVDAYAKAWTENGKAEKGFLEYIENPAKVSFPWSMIDKITPRPDASVKKMLEDAGFTDTESIVTSKNTYVAPFVNAEEAQYLVIENAFPNGRPALENAGVMFTSRETVEKVERMKVCTCLNPLHTALAVYGCLLGYTKISDEMKDADLVKLVEIIGYKEGLPVVTDPGILSPKKFIDEVLQIRVPNPFMPDTPQRIACDTSQKLSIRFGIRMPGYLLLSRTIWTVETVYIRPWTGESAEMYSGAGEYGQSGQVYVAENGSVYHRDLSCTYLALSIHACSMSSVQHLRNQYGARYVQCERCGHVSDKNQTVFITDRGTAWHTDRHCSGLKRTMDGMSQKEAEQSGLRPCSRCGASGGGDA